MINFQFFQNRLENKWSNEILNNSFYQHSNFCSNQKSDSDTNNIVLRKKCHKFFNHLFVIKDIK